LVLAFVALPLAAAQQIPHLRTYPTRLLLHIPSWFRQQSDLVEERSEFTDRFA
jgi:hypothetical protein